MKRIDDTIYDLLDTKTDELVTFSKVTLFADGTAMTDGKCDGVIYRKLGNEYFKRNFTGPINVKWFGAKGDGVSNDTSAILLSITTCNNFINPTLLFPFGTYIINSSIDINISNLLFKGENATLDFSGNIQDYAINLFGTSIPYSQSNKKISGFLIKRTGAKAGIGLKLNSVGPGDGGASHIEVSNVGISGFDKGVFLGDRSYLLNFNNIDIFECNTCIFSPVDVFDGGERINFSNSVFFNSLLAIDIRNQFSDFYFNKCSFDYNEKQINVNGSRVHVTNCHIESHTYDLEMSTVSGNGGFLSIVSCTLTNTGVINNGRFCLVGENSHFIFKDSFINNYLTADKIYASGLGNVIIENISSFVIGDNPLISCVQNNLLADSSFEENTIIDDYSISKDTAAIVDKYIGENIKLSISTDNFNSGVKSLYANKVGGQGSLAEFILNVPIGKQKNIGAKLFYKAVNISGYFEIKVYYAFVLNGVVKKQSLILNDNAINIVDNTFRELYFLTEKSLKSLSWANSLLIKFDLIGLNGAGNATSGIYFDDILITEI
ncbi:hypothetical protein FA046_12250 [Pedobacter cryophilus]|uniref:Rhamnogalacturonase A/B/Epimerase-like pectate lyase domain-containing protein n=2 Tax=Pedobacter cryophilus TaxID=2571271 RepID=A0A4U1BW47_9SPHI|nr:hypothetical protein FA046_12250 [Pedobacter cryophilus]